MYSICCIWCTCRFRHTDINLDCHHPQYTLGISLRISSLLAINYNYELLAILCMNSIKYCSGNNIIIDIIH